MSNEAVEKPRSENEGRFLGMIYVSEDNDRRFWRDCENRIFLKRDHFSPK